MNLVDKTRVRAGHGHPGKRLDECQQYLVRAGKRLRDGKLWSPLSPSRIGLARRVQHWGREIGGVSPPHLRWRMNSNIGRIQHLEALVAELRRERDDLRSKGAASKRAGEVGPDRSDVVPEGLEELPRWITSISARMAMAAEREHVALVAELSAQLAAGGSKLASCKEEMQPTISDRHYEVTRQSRYGFARSQGW